MTRPTFSYQPLKGEPRVPDCAVPVTALQRGSAQRALALQIARAFRRFELRPTGPLLISRAKVASYFADDTGGLTDRELLEFYRQIGDAQRSWLQLQASAAQRAAVYPVEQMNLVDDFATMAATLGTPAPAALLQAHPQGQAEEARALGRLARAFVNAVRVLHGIDLDPLFRDAGSAQEFCEAFALAAATLHKRGHTATAEPPRETLGIVLAQLIHCAIADLNRYRSAGLREQSLVIWQCQSLLYSLMRLLHSAQRELPEPRLLAAAVGSTHAFSAVTEMVEAFMDPSADVSSIPAQLDVLRGKLEELARELAAFASRPPTS